MLSIKIMADSETAFEHIRKDEEFMRGRINIILTYIFVHMKQIGLVDTCGSIQAWGSINIAICLAWKNSSLCNRPNNRETYLVPGIPNRENSKTAFWLLIENESSRSCSALNTPVRWCWNDDWYEVMGVVPVLRYNKEENYHHDFYIIWAEAHDKLVSFPAASMRIITQCRFPVNVPQVR